MKKFSTVLAVLAFTTISTFAQDSLRYKEFKFYAGAANAGVNLHNNFRNHFNMKEVFPFYPVAGASFGYNRRYLAFEMGMDFGSQYRPIDSIYTTGLKVTNMFLNVKFPIVNTPKSTLYGLTHFNMQTQEFKVDSTSSSSDLFALTSTSVEKNFGTAGLGFEYNYKLKVMDNQSYVIGVRASYNFYIHENPWTKGNFVKNELKGFSNPDLGYFNASFFVAYRFYNQF